MRRNVPQITAALVTFTAGFLTVGEFEHLAEALPLALCVFVLTSLLPEFRLTLPCEFDSHKIMVAAITFLLWLPVLAFFLPLLMPPDGLSNCTLNVP